MKRDSGEKNDNVKSLFNYFYAKFEDYSCLFYLKCVDICFFWLSLYRNYDNAVICIDWLFKSTLSDTFQ